MDIPPGSGPSLEGRAGQAWYRRWYLWAVVIAVAVGALLLAY